MKVKPKKDVHEELARDLASLAVRGGYLIFGVEEDKASHTFTVVDMPLPAHLDQTVDQVAPNAGPSGPSETGPNAVLVARTGQDAEQRPSFRRFTTGGSMWA